MTKAIEAVKGEQKNSTVLKPDQQKAIELLALGFADKDIAEGLKIRRETLWRWKRHDPQFQAALQERRAMLTDSAAERLHGLLDQAVSVVHLSLHSKHADPRLAMSLLKSLGVMERGQEMGRAGFGEVQVTAGDAEVERKLAAVEGERRVLGLGKGAGDS